MPDPTRPAIGGNAVLRAAIVGAGRMGRHHVNALARLALPVHIVGVCDREPGRAHDLAAVAASRAFSSIRDLITGARPDVVHVCTPPAAHVETALAALESGAHVYVEKPFALTASDARRLIDMARARKRLVCAGHQLLRDQAFGTLLARAADLGRLVQIDSHFAFRTVGGPAARGSAPALASQLVDILPHPLYLLVAALERGAAAAPIELAWAHASPTDLHAVLRAGDLVGRLSVSLRARPVASSLTLIGANGSLTCDFVRSIVVGAANPGTEALEKILNPMVEGGQLVWRTARSLARRLGSRAEYPGLVELLGDFYGAIDAGGQAPISDEHLVRVTGLFEQLAAGIRDRSQAGVGSPVSDRAARRAAVTRPIVVTGARGFLGSAIARACGRVRGVARALDPDQTTDGDWVIADLSNGISPAALAGADVVVHAAAETAGGYGAHQRNTIDATRHLLRAMRTAGVQRLVLISSLSVLRPPRTPWERQDEWTPRPDDPRRLGAYTWGKCQQEALVEREAPALGIATRIVRPGALLDWRRPELPALMGRRLFGRWHLGLGRPGLPIAVCDVRRAAEAIAWCVDHFDDAQPVVNLFDPTIVTRGALLARLREHGWSGRMLWVPISLVALGVTLAHGAFAVFRGERPAPLAAWSILRPRRYDSLLSEFVLRAAHGGDTPRRPITPLPHHPITPFLSSP